MRYDATMAMDTRTSAVMSNSSTIPLIAPNMMGAPQKRTGIHTAASSCSETNDNARPATPVMMSARSHFCSLMISVNADIFYLLDTRRG